MRRIRNESAAEVRAELERRCWAGVVGRVALHAGSTLEDVCAYSARPSVARARFRAWSVVRHMFAASYPEIGDVWGYHHTSVIYGIRQAAEEDISAAKLVEKLGLRALHERDCESSAAGAA